MDSNPSFDRTFVRVAGCCWMVTSITTLGLIFIPRLVPPAADLASQAALVHNRLYMIRAWIGIVHPFIALIGAAGVLTVRVRAATGTAICGFTFFALWAAGEGVQQSLILVALNWRWRTMFLSGSESTRTALAPLITGFDAMSDGLFFFLVLAFVVANFLFCAATWSGAPLQRLIAVFFALAAGLGVLSFSTRYGGGIVPAGAMDLAYPLIQPAGRFLTGVWLWRAAQAAAGIGSADVVQSAAK
jgi:hypothetical protein